MSRLAHLNLAMQKKTISSHAQNPATSDLPPRLARDLSRTRERTSPLHVDGVPGSGGNADAALPVGSLADLLSGPLGDLAARSLRIRPRQERSIRSVERILSAGAEIALRQRGMKGISIEKIAKAAGVTPQAAYRYFKDADELIRTVLRCIVVREHERFVALLSDRLLSGEAEMAAAVVGTVLDTCERLYRFPTYLQEEVLLEYRQVGYDASLLMAESVGTCADRLDVRQWLDGVTASVAIMATIAVATSFFSRKSAPLRGSRLEDTLTSLFVSVLRSGGNSPDAFREAGSAFAHQFERRIG